MPFISASLFLILLPTQPVFVVDVADLRRFPSREVTNAYLDLVRVYRDNLLTDRDARPHMVRQYDEILREVDRRFIAWDTLDSAYRFHELFVPTLLENLYFILGPDAYYRGQMPYPVPLEFFKEIDR